jgi:hypothetical protein
VKYSIEQPTMNIRQRVALVHLLVLGSAVIVAVLGVLVSDRWWLAIFGVVAGGGMLIMSIRCPSCRKRVLARSIRVFGITVRANVPWPPPWCESCGFRWS